MGNELEYFIFCAFWLLAWACLYPLGTSRDPPSSVGNWNQDHKAGSMPRCPNFRKWRQNSLTYRNPNPAPGCLNKMVKFEFRQKNKSLQMVLLKTLPIVFCDVPSLWSCGSRKEPRKFSLVLDFNNLSSSSGVLQNFQNLGFQRSWKLLQSLHSTRFPSNSCQGLRKSSEIQKKRFFA